jgi:hypothetical protein
MEARSYKPNLELSQRQFKIFKQLIIELLVLEAGGGLQERLGVSPHIGGVLPDWHAEHELPHAIVEALRLDLAPAGRGSEAYPQKALLVKDQPASVEVWIFDPGWGGLRHLPSSATGRMGGYIYHPLLLAGSLGLAAPEGGRHHPEIVGGGVNCGKLHSSS